MKVLIADLEANGLLDTITRHWCLSIGDPLTDEVICYADQAGYKPMSEGFERLTKADRVVFHNGLGYDLHAINLFVPDHLKLKFSQVYDTLVISKMLFPDRRSHALAAWGVDLGFPKGDFNDFDKWHPAMATYCNQDVLVTMKVYRKLQKELIGWFKQKKVDWRPAVALEHKVAFCLHLQEQHGFKLDMPKLTELYIELSGEKADIERGLQELFKPVFIPEKASWDWKARVWNDVEVTLPKVSNKGRGVTKGIPYTKVTLQPFNAGSRPQCTYRISQAHSDWEPVKTTPTGVPQINEATLKNLIYPEAAALNRYLRISKQLGQVSEGANAWMKLERNGRIHGRINQVGARTHRMSHFSPNVAQVDKKDLRMREVWTANEGDKLVGCDAEGLELRGLANRLFPYDGGAYAKAVIYGDKAKGTDAHSRTMKAAGMPDRDSSKTLIYATLYGSGNPNLGQIYVSAWKSHGVVKKGRLAGIGKRIRNDLAKGIKGLEELTDLCKQQTRDNKYLISADLRPILSDSEHSSLNSLLQSDGAVVMKEALVHFHFKLCVDAGHVDPVSFYPKTFNYCANVHDEVQMSVRPQHSEDIGKLFAQGIKEAGINLNMNCELSGAYEIGNNWKDTH